MKENGRDAVDNLGGDYESGLNRREFLRVIGGGITVLFTVGVRPAVLQQRGGGREYPEDFNAYLRIGEDGRVSCFTGKIEMGQGIITSLGQMLAEELEVPLHLVDMVMGDTALCPYDSATVGSRSTKYFGPPLRQAAAEAKAILLQLASEQLGVPQARLIARAGTIVRSDDPRVKVTYAELAKGKRIERHLGAEAPLKLQSQHTVSGVPTPRRDAPKKVSGEAQYTGDLRLPGMLYAKILRPPAHGAKMKTVDLAAARTVPGAVIVEDGDLVAVLHEHPDEAERALQQINAEYETLKPGVDNQTIFAHLEGAASGGNVVTEAGSLEVGKSQADRAFDSSFYNHYVAHAAAETHTAVVHIEGDDVMVWASTQSPFRVRESVAQALDVPVEKVRVRTPCVGGGFGGKTFSQQTVEAARLAKLCGRPVQVAWSRREEFFYDTFRPAAIIKAKSGLNSSGRIVYWDFDIYFAGTRSSEPIYDIPHYRVLSRGNRGGTGAHPFGTGAWRGPGSNTNVFAMESHTDIMAQAAGIDPYTFRMNNLADARMRRVLKAAADKFGHSFSRGPSGKGYGIACTNYLNTYVTTMAEVEVNRSNGAVQVKRVVCAQDTGEVINPQGIRLQVEGCVTMGLGYVLSEEVKFQGGEVLDRNFDSYEITRFSWVPKIEVVIVDNPDLPPQGCGEPAITTMGAVIANAVYDAVGARVYTLPMTPERILQAL